MKLIIKDKEYGIDGFNFSVNFGNTDERENLDITLADEINISDFTIELGSIFEGTLSIKTAKKTYNFEDFTLQQVNTYVDNKSERTSIRFAK